MLRLDPEIFLLKIMMEIAFSSLLLAALLFLAKISLWNKLNNQQPREHCLPFSVCGAIIPFSGDSINTLFPGDVSLCQVRY